MRSNLRRAHSLWRIAASAAALVPVAHSLLTAQVLELRHVFEQYNDFKIEGGAWMIGPSYSRVNPTTSDVTAGDTAFHVNQYLSVDYKSVRLGLTARGALILAPFIRFSPEMPAALGGASSRWSATLSWEGNFVQSGADDPDAALQPDNSVYSPKSSFSILVGFWARTEQDSSLWLASALQRCPDVDPNLIRQWAAARRGVVWSWAGHGAVDTFDYASFPLDTNSYVRGMVMPAVALPDHMSRQGFSAAVGLGSGKYAGSGPLSSFLNIGGKQTEDAHRSGSLFDVGINPIATARYRLGDVIAQLDIAGEDLNFGLITRSFGVVDVEAGVKYLEHAFRRGSRGTTRPEFFLGVRYAPPVSDGARYFERGEFDSFGFSDDSDGDGIPDDVERNVVGSDPHLADSDGDGVSDGLEVVTYRSNPLVADSDGDGLSDGSELASGPRTDPLRADTDGDGLTDSEERRNGTDPIVPSGGERER